MAPSNYLLTLFIAKIMQDSFHILFARKWQLTDETTGEIKKGTSVKCIPTSVSASTLDTKGSDVIKFTCPTEVFSQLPKIPAVYNIEFDFKSDTKGKASFSFVKLHGLVNPNEGK